MGFFSRHRVKTGSEAHPASYRTGTGGSYPGSKAAEVNNAWRYASTPQYVFMAQCLIKQ